jgi:rRNA-processing protein FCF1
MKKLQKLFPEFYQKPLNESDFEKKYNNTIVLDTNYLLAIIESPTTISEKYIEALEKVKDHIYIPYLVALEFNFRKSSIKKQKSKDIQAYKDNIKNSIKNVSDCIIEGKILKNHDIDNEIFSREISNLTTEYQKNINEKVENKIQSIITNKEDDLYNKLISIIEDKIGDPYTQEKIDEIQKDGEKRYSDKIPPGFDDETKDQSDDPTRRYGEINYLKKYGDLIIWKDILEYSKNPEFKGKKIIFVTNDGTSKNKSDWLYKFGNLTVGPHIYLMNELQTVSGKEYYILNNLRFIQLASKLTDEQIDNLQQKSTIYYSADDDKQFSSLNDISNIIKHKYISDELREEQNDKNMLFNQLKREKEIDWEERQNRILEEIDLQELSLKERQRLEQRLRLEKILRQNRILEEIDLEKLNLKERRLLEQRRMQSRMIEDTLRWKDKQFQNETRDRETDL